MKSINSDIKTPPRISFNWIWGEALEYVQKPGVPSDHIKQFINHLEQKHRTRMNGAKRPTQSV